MDNLDPIFIDFLNYCPQAFEEMKHEKGLCDLAERVAQNNLYLEYRSNFLSTFHKKVLEHFKNDGEFLKVYEDETQRPAFTQKFDDYSFRFLKYAEDLKYGVHQNVQ